MISKVNVNVPHVHQDNSHDPPAEDSNHPLLLIKISHRHKNEEMMTVKENYRYT